MSRPSWLAAISIFSAAARANLCAPKAADLATLLAEEAVEAAFEPTVEPTVRPADAAVDLVLRRAWGALAHAAWSSSAYGER